jgi:hypothetical protein
MAWYDTQKTGALVARVSGDVDLLQEGCSKVGVIVVLCVVCVLLLCMGVIT